jgi:TPR repeat protein
MGQKKYLDSEVRGTLLAAARLLMAENANFTTKTLLAGSGISRIQFRRCFGDKEKLLAALVREDVQGLSGILEAAQPAAQFVEESVQRAVGSDIAPQSQTLAPPQTDAWLERRLRVFERALQGLEKRQDKFEQELTKRLAIISETLDEVSAAPIIPQPAPAPVPQPEPRPAPIPAAPVASASDRPVRPTVMAHIAEIADFEPAPAPESEKPISETEMAEFIAEARRVARNAQLAMPAPPPPQTRWLAWSGVAFIFAIACAGILFATGALSHAQVTAPLQADSGTAHRHVAAKGVARVMALADSGDSAAQTVLALAYLRGAGVASDTSAARRWSMAAAAQGQPVAQYLLGTLYLQHDDGEAARWFHAAALQGNVKAMHNLAIAYAEGHGVTKDPAQAVQWFVRAAGQGYRDSQFDLAVMYERGLGVPQSARAALKWYLVAGAHGDAPSVERAQFLRGQMDAMEINAAADEAKSFVPQPSGSFANDLPAI